MRSSNNNKVCQVCLLTWPQTRHSTCRLLSWLLQRIAEWNGSAQSAVNQRESRQILERRRDWVAIGIGRAHVNIIASLRINNGLKCQRGTSSICFSAANPTTTATTARTTTKRLVPPIALYVWCTPSPSYYICMSVLKIKPKLNWSELNNAMALKEASSRFSNKFAECLSASESETNLWHVFQFLCPLPPPSPSAHPARKPASFRVNLPKVSELLCPQYLCLSLPLFLSIKKRKLQTPTAQEKCATACPRGTSRLHHWSTPCNFVAF